MTFLDNKETFFKTSCIQNNDDKKTSSTQQNNNRTSFS